MLSKRSNPIFLEVKSMIRTYSDLINIPDFLERFNYLKLDGSVGQETFGFDRYLNQKFYQSYEWRTFRRDMILRDLGCDLAFPNYEIVGYVLLHHLNPITPEDISKRTDVLMNPENVVCVSLNTHNAIHYGDESLVDISVVERKAGDTKLW